MSNPWSINPKTNIRLDDEYRLVGADFNHRTCMFHDFSPKIHKSGWTIVKTVYLICRFTILTSWPFVVYILMTDHDADDCTPWEYPQEIIYIVLVSTVVVLLNASDIWTV